MSWTNSTILLTSWGFLYGRWTMKKTRTSFLQDFMFACSMYPADPETLANVEKEVIHQV